MTATMPMRQLPPAEPADWAALAARFTDLADRADRDWPGLCARAAQGEGNARVLLRLAQDLRVAANEVRAARHARTADAEERALEIREAEVRGYQQGLAANRRPARHGGDRPLLNVVKGGGVAGMAGAVFHAGSRHGVAVKLTAGAAAVAAAGTLSAATVHRLDDETVYVPRPHVSHGVLAPSRAVPVASSVPFMPAPKGHHHYPAELHRALVLSTPAPAPVVTPPPPPRDTSTRDTGTQDTTWQGDGRQQDGSQDNSWQQQDQQSQWQQQDHRDHWNQGDQQYQGDQGGRWQSYQDGSWTYHDHGHDQGWQQQGQRGGWQGN